MKILFGVSSVGLGHARRSLVLAKRIRSRGPGGLQINWIAAEPVQSLLEMNGESVLDVSRSLTSHSTAMESAVKDGRLGDMSKVARFSSAIARSNYSLMKGHLNGYDMLIQDEFVETMFHFMWDKNPNFPSNRCVITDYVQLQTRSMNPFSRFVVQYANRMLRKSFLDSRVRIFADEVESLPKRERNWTRNNFDIVGPILDDVPAQSREELKRALFPNAGNGKLIVVTIGGTGIGKQLIDFILANAEWFSDRLEANIAVLPGPRVDSTAHKEVPNAAVLPTTLNTLEYFKAADCVVTQAGASTLNEVASIGTPCVCVPIENHWEQEANAERFSSKYGFKVVNYRSLNKEFLLESINHAMNSTYSPLRSSGADRAASLILECLDST